MESLKEGNNGNYKLKILTYILLFVVLYGVCNTYVYFADLVPFGMGLVLAVFSIGLNGFILGGVYAGAYTLANFTLLSFFQSLCVAGVLALLQYLRLKKNYNPKSWQLFLIALLSLLVYIFTNLKDTNSNMALLVSCILSIIFLYTSLVFLQATFGRVMMVKLSLDEKICGSVVLVVFIIGMSASNIYVLNLGLIIGTLIILASTYLNGSGTVLILSALIGVGFGINTLDPSFLSLFVFMGMMSIAFKCNFKYLSALSVIVSYIAFELFFGLGISWGGILSVFLGGILISFVPMKTLEYFGQLFEVKSQILYKNIIIQSKKLIINRVKELSSVFGEMDSVYRNMVKGVLPDTKAKELLKDELMLSLCKTCENRNICFRSNGDFLEKSLDTIIDIAYEKGKVLLIDLPQYLTANCNKMSQLVLTLNNLLASYKEYSNAISNLDTSRILIANQLSGVSNLLDVLSHEVNINISFDSRIENRIKEDLCYKKILCVDAIVYEKDIQTKYVNLIIKTDTIDEKKIEKYVSKIVGSSLMIKSIEPSEIVSASLVSMITRPNYDIVFGSANINKCGVKQSGDSHSLIKIDDGKYMVSLCDGMGSGEHAHDISNLTISLIENFYKAGFDNDIILSSINKLLSLTEDENFSTIDLCVIDGKKNTYDFVKLGATNGYIKRENGAIETIESSSLPVGVLEDIRPHIVKKLLNPYDMLIFMSDGVSDSFGEKVSLPVYLSSLNIINPQTLSDEILNKAMELSDNVSKDDMTVICVRVFENV